VNTVPDVNSSLAVPPAAQVHASLGALFADIRPQVEFELVMANVLLPIYHRQYWIGLQLPPGANTWPSFFWMDRQMPGGWLSSAH
jgi:hypothetical protein